jgi:hypothetical protein
MLIAFLESMRRPGRASLLWASLAAVFLVASAYVRPAAYLLWIVLVGVGLLVYHSRWRALLVYGALSVLGIGAWVAHNSAVFGNPTFSTIGIYNLLYYRAVSVESLGSGAAVEDTYVELSRRVEEQLGRDTSVVNSGTRHGHYAVTADLQPVMQAVAFEVFRTYPLVYLATIPLGMYRILLSLNSGIPWLQGIALVMNVFLLILAALGLWVWWRARDYAFFWLVFLLCAYFIVGTLSVQTSGIDVRARTMLTPLLAIAALTGVQSTKVARKL